MVDVNMGKVEPHQLQFFAIHDHHLAVVPHQVARRSRYGDPICEKSRFQIAKSLFSSAVRERYQRLDKDTLSIAVTVDDPKAYTKPWVGKPIRYSLRPRVEIGEWYCTIEDENRFNEKIRFPTFVTGDGKK